MDFGPVLAARPFGEKPDSLHMRFYTCRGAGVQRSLEAALLLILLHERSQSCFKFTHTSFIPPENALMSKFHVSIEVITDRVSLLSNGPPPRK